MALGGPHATAATGWQDHTIRGATSGALKKKLGITVEATREVSVLLAEFATVWDELFPAEQARIVQLLVERVDVQEGVIEVLIRAEGLASLVAELRQQDERKAA
jgi:hypothetical protein